MLDTAVFWNSDKRQIIIYFFIHKKTQKGDKFMIFRDALWMIGCWGCVSELAMMTVGVSCFDLIAYVFCATQIKSRFHSPLAGDDDQKCSHKSASIKYLCPATNTIYIHKATVLCLSSSSKTCAFIIRNCILSFTVKWKLFMSCNCLEICLHNRKFRHSELIKEGYATTPFTARCQWAALWTK